MISMRRTGLSLIICLGLFACTTYEVEVASEKRGIALAQVMAVVETDPVFSLDDAADDPAIWVNSTDPSNSLVLGTDKQYGLMIYDMQGTEVQALAEGRLNNVDVRQGVAFNGELYDVAAASSRTHNSLDLFLLDRENGVASFIGRQMLELPEPYGSCLYLDNDDSLSVFVNDKNGRYQQWLVESVTPLQMSLVREFSVLTQPEGCAADDLTGDLFVGEEEAALWKFSADAEADNSRLMLDLANAGVLVADIEGMDIYRVNEHTAYLVVSSQGDFTYGVYEAQGDHAYLGSFQVVDNLEMNIDGTQETDGLTLVNQNLGGFFDKGMLVVQDGFNRNAEDRGYEAQNFKYIPWQAIADALELEVIQ